MMVHDRNDTSFDEQYTLTGMKFADIVHFMDILLRHDNSIMFITIESDVIDHRKLMRRPGCNDKRIKSEFGFVNRDEFDKVSYYPLARVIECEQSL